MKYYDKFQKIIKKIQKGELCNTNCELLNLLIQDFDCIEIYNSEDTLLSDVYFTLKHYANGEEPIEASELNYFLECLEGKRTHNFEEKIKIILANRKNISDNSDMILY